MVDYQVMFLISFAFRLVYVLNEPADHVRVYSRCAFPCSRQGNTYVSFDGSMVANFSTDDSRYYIENIGSMSSAVYCIEKAGPFYVKGRTINGVNEYACWKDTVYQSKENVKVLYHTGFRPIVGRPDICDVCNGTSMDIVGVIKAAANKRGCEIEIGCNIPWHCPVVDSSKQTLCSQCEPSGNDDGLCCKHHNY